MDCKNRSALVLLVSRVWQFFFTRQLTLNMCMWLSLIKAPVHVNMFWFESLEPQQIWLFSYVISKELIIVCGLVKWYEQEEEVCCHGDRHMGVAFTSEVMTPWPLTKRQACSALLDPNALCKAAVLPLATVFSHTENLKKKIKLRLKFSFQYQKKILTCFLGRKQNEDVWMWEFICKTLFCRCYQ